jgi:hypothetical protein
MFKNKANRKVCNVQIVDYKTKAPYMEYKLANTTGLNISSDSVYAMGDGSRQIAFQNPLEGSVTIEAQVVPFKIYALYSDGIIDTTADCYMRATITCATADELPLSVSDGTIVAGSVFVYPEGQFGGTAITEIAYSSSTNTIAPESGKSGKFVKDSKYEVGFLLTRSTGVQKVALNNSRLPKDVTIYMDTFDKADDGNIVPFRITIKKATIQRNLDLSFSSEGDPQSITMTFDILEQDKNNFVEITEITEDATINPPAQTSSP